jgi:hypothetical protein
LNGLEYEQIHDALERATPLYVHRWSEALSRMTEVNFRLLTRLLTQIERVLSVNDLHLVSTSVVEAARDSLVIGPR